MNGFLKIEDNIIEVEITKEQLGGLTDLHFKEIDGKKKYRFQYDSRIYHQDAKRGMFAPGYIVGGKSIVDCLFKYKLEENLVR